MLGYQKLDVYRRAIEFLALASQIATSARSGNSFLTDLTWNWVDWNPAPPDKNLGLWGAVTLASSGPLRLRDPQVISRLDLPSLEEGHLTVKVEAENAAVRAIEAVVSGAIEGAWFSQPVALAPREVRGIAFAPEQVSSLNLHRPRLWWPTQMRAQELYDVTLTAEVEGRASDDATARFGIRQVTSRLTDEGTRLFQVNGWNVLIRGAGFAPDMFLRRPTQRIEDEIAYVKDMNLNAIRLEGKLGLDPLMDACDRQGILVVAGWCCCDHREIWSGWGDEQRRVSAASLHDQIRLLRNHPSALVWLNGSDIPLPPAIEERYLEELKAADWPNPFIASATSVVTPGSGATGMKMPGPCMWVPPNYWGSDRDHRGAFGFNTETSMGAAIPPLASLKKFLPADHLWPIDDVWTFHSGSATFIDLSVFTAAVDGRHGPSATVEDFARKSQLMAYEGVRAMFEAYGRNKYHSTGVIQWLLNNAWPGLIWHLYDYFLVPAGGYFGAKKGCEPLHVQYGHDDRAVVVVNGHPTGFPKLVVRAELVNLDATVRWSREATLSVGADSSTTVFTVPEVPERSATFFVRLTLRDAAGKAVSRNLYWLSRRPDVLDEENAVWTHTPTKSYADFTALATLPAAVLTATATRVTDGEDELVRVALHNPGGRLAFFVRVTVGRAPGGEEILPVRWDDNDISLMPGERRQLVARYRIADRGGAPPSVALEGWNVAPAAVAWD